jgi:hypothetical protein
MAVNSTHPDYEAAALNWARARDVLGGEDAVKAGGEKYLPRLDSQTDEEFAAYAKRASFFNATARTSEAYQGLIFRRPPFVKLPEGSSGLGKAMQEFANDADMLGTSLRQQPAPLIVAVANQRAFRVAQVLPADDFTLAEFHGGRILERSSIVNTFLNLSSSPSALSRPGQRFPSAALPRAFSP